MLLIVFPLERAGERLKPKFKKNFSWGIYKRPPIASNELLFSTEIDRSARSGGGRFEKFATPYIIERHAAAAAAAERHARAGSLNMALAALPVFSNCRIESPAASARRS